MKLAETEIQNSKDLKIVKRRRLICRKVKDQQKQLKEFIFFECEKFRRNEDTHLKSYDKFIL